MLLSRGLSFVNCPLPPSNLPAEMGCATRGSPQTPPGTPRCPVQHPALGCQHHTGTCPCGLLALPLGWHFSCPHQRALDVLFFPQSCQPHHFTLMAFCSTTSDCVGHCVCSSFPRLSWQLRAIPASWQRSRATCATTGTTVLQQRLHRVCFGTQPLQPSVRGEYRQHTGGKNHQQQEAVCLQVFPKNPRSVSRIPTSRVREQAAGVPSGVGAAKRCRRRCWEPAVCPHLSPRVRGPAGADADTEMQTLDARGSRCRAGVSSAKQLV